MKEIIQKWLYEAIGIKLDIKTLGKDLSDGVIFAKLLSSYKVVNEKVVKHILPSDNPKVCEHNLHELCVWFNILDIKFDNEIISHIINGRTTACLKLLYQLYLALNDKTHFFTTKKHLRSHNKKQFQCHLFRERTSTKKETDTEVAKEQCVSKLNSSIPEKPLTLKCENFKTKEVEQIKKSEKLYDTMRLEDIEFVRYELKNVPNTKLRKRQHSDLSDQFFQNESQVNKDLRKQEMITLKNLELEHKTKPKQSFEILAPVTDDKPAEKTEREQLKTRISENILRQSAYEKELTTKKLQSNYEDKINQNRFLDIKKTIDNESVKYENYFSTCKTSEEEIACQLETIKLMELHRKLYNEKIRKRNKKRLAICQQIVKDSVNLAIKISECGKHSITNELINEWKELLTRNKSIFKDKAVNSDNNIAILNIDNIDEQTVTDEDFDDYNHLIGNWFDQTQEDVSYDDMFVLAHIIYDLQKAKLPHVMPLRPADIPKYRTTSILSGAFSELQIIILKTLLVKSKVCVVDVESAIKFCIDRYKLEADIKMPDIPSKSDRSRSGKSGKSGTSDTASTKKSKLSTKQVTPTIAYKDEEVQTTSSLLDNSLTSKGLSTVAEIGMQLYNLQTFNDITAEQITNLLVEYLKTKVDIEGWVLINFPSTLYEAYNLETVLSGKEYPDIFQIPKNKRVTSNSSPHTLSDENHDTKMKHSKLVYLPTKKQEAFCSYFTSFINVIKQDEFFITTPQTETNAEPKVDSGSLTSISMREMFEGDEAALDLTTVYKREGILKNIYYKTMDFNTLKDVARAILQCDNDVEKIPSNEIFGEEVINYYGEGSTATNGRQVGKTSKKSTLKKTPKGKDELVIAREFLEQLNISINKLVTGTETESQVNDEKNKTKQETELEMNQLPSPDNWIYAEFPIAIEDKISLANLWVKMEKKYINEVKHILQVNKNIESEIPIYIKYINRIMGDAYSENDNSTENIVKCFVQQFNDLLQIRSLDEKILDHLSNDSFNMERQLWAIIDERRNKLEKKRRDIIEIGWVANKMIAIMNNYLSLFDIEVNRCNKTLEMLYMYYSRMCFIPPQDDILFISPLSATENECDLCKIKLTIGKMLTTEKEMNVINPANHIITRAVQHYFLEISQTKSDSDYIIDIYDNFIKYRKEEYIKREKQKSTREMYYFSKHKRESDTEEIDENLISFLETDDNKLKNVLIEWRYVVNSELDRLKWRTNVIKEKAIRDLENLEKQMTQVFYGHYNKIISDYFKENECVDNLCSIFHSAMKRHLPIRGNVITDGNFVYIEEEAKLSNIENLVECHRINKLCFSVEQLQMITDRLKSVAPNGVIKKQTLRFIVEDMIYYEESPDSFQLFPEHWKTLNSKQLIQLFEDAFGMSSTIYWKNFILSCLDVSFPDMQDIIDCKEQFALRDKENTGTISYDDYENITFWFQTNINYNEDEYKPNSIKNFLFSLFKVDENIFNYKDFLLMFSKDKSSAKGFGKALASLSGKSVIVSGENAHLEEILIEYNDLLSKLAKDVLNDIITKILNDLEGVKIEELNKEIDPTDNKNIDIIFESPYKQSIKSLESKHEEIANSSEMSFKLEERKNSRDKESQTISLTELLYDQYIVKNKLYQWTTKMPSDLIITLLESFVFPVLELYDDYVIIENTKWDLKQTVIRLTKDGYVNIPLLMEETSIHSMFLQTHIFQIFSFPSAVKQKINEMCFPQL